MKKGFFALTGAVVGAVAGAAAVNKLKGQVVYTDVDKYKGYYHILNQWLILKQEGKTLEKYFTDNNYKTIAIYGMGELGNRLYEDLKNTGIEIKYVMDRNLSGTYYSELEVMDKDDELAEVDVMVVTAAFAFDEIQEELSKKVDFPIVSLEDVVYGI